jgi:hypothetical protein
MRNCRVPIWKENIFFWQRNRGFAWRRTLQTKPKADTAKGKKTPFPDRYLLEFFPEFHQQVKAGSSDDGHDTLKNPGNWSIQPGYPGKRRKGNRLPQWQVKT